MDRERKAIAEECFLTKAAGSCQSQHRRSRLIVIVEDNFRDRQDTAHFQRAEYFPQRRFSIWNFAKNRNQQCTIELVALEPALAQCRLNETYVAQPRSVRLVLRPPQHSRLDVSGHDTPIGTDLSRRRHSQSSRSAARIQYCHARLEGQMLDDRCCSIRLGKRVVQFNQPAQPCRTRHGSPARQNEIRQEPENEQRDACDDHHTG